MENKMHNITNEKINEAFSKLPSWLNEAFFSVDTLKKIKNLGEKFNLSESEIAEIDSFISYIILGLLNNKEIIEELFNQPGINKERIESIFTEIINPICEEIKNKAFFLKRESQLNSVFADLPKEVEEAIELSNWQKTLVEISKENNLNIEQAGVLEEITIKTMRNEISHEDYPGQLSSKLSLDEKKTSKIVSSVAEKIFDVIREIMREEEESKEEVVSVNKSNEIPLPPYVNDSKAGQISPETETAEPPIPPYVKKDTPEIGDTSHEFKTPKPEEMIGGDFSIPKTAEINLKNDNQNTDITNAPKISHDPYREII